MRTSLVAVAAVSLFLSVSQSAQAFSLLPSREGFDASVTKSGGEDISAGSHPDAVHLHLQFATSGGFTDGDPRNLRLAFPSGFLAAPVAADECTTAAVEDCPDSSQVGLVALKTGAEGGITRYFPVYNLQPPFGSPEAIGFAPFGVSMRFFAELREADDAIVFHLDNLPQQFDLQAMDLTLWGSPWLPSHDGQRGACLDEQTGGSLGQCLVFGAFPAPDYRIKSYLTLPAGPCQVPMRWEAAAVSWQGESTGTTRESHNSERTLSLSDCLRSLSSGYLKLNTEHAASATGLIFHLEINDGGGLFNEGGHVTAATERGVLTFPEGFTINPSLGAGLGACSEAQVARESAATPPGAGCPENSKIGDVSAEGLMGSGEPVGGAIYLATPYENPLHSLVAVYVVVASAQRGLFQKAIGKVEPDPRSGRLVATFEHLPVLHYNQLEIALRTGQRAPFITPATCGGYRAELELTPWSRPSERIHNASAFFISSGEGGGPCPSGGVAPFHPGMEAGSLNSQAGAFSPFYLQMTRTDSEQEITSYSATFPPGLLGKIAGVPFCPDAAIEAAKGRSGLEERERPSCPAASSIGRTVSGYGVGSALAYAPGSLYLAGPFHGAPISVVAVDSALVGPFDLGTVVVRSAVRIDPVTAQVSLDSAGSDPIPHILKGIPIHLRDIRVYVDRPGFMVNPTSCNVLQTSSLLTGAGSDFFSSGDDVQAGSSQRFQLANCSALGFQPAFSLRLKGGTTRGRYPALQAELRPRPGDANLGEAAVTLPHSLFLAQQHIGTVCTARQLAAQACPLGSQIGTASAITPLLDEPLTGPVVLRSSSHRIPDILADLRGSGIEIQVQGRVSSSKDGGLRGSFEVLPDAPVTRFTMNLFGGRKGLLQNAENLCAKRQFGRAVFVAQDKAVARLRPRLSVRCRKGGKR